MMFGNADRELERGASYANGDRIGPAPTFGEMWRGVVDDTFASIKLGGELSSSWRSLEEAYDRNIDDIFAATGQRNVNPMRAYYVPEGPDAVPARDLDAPARYDAWRQELAEQFPGARHLIRPDDPIALDAQRLARDAEAREHATWDRMEDWGALRYVPFVWSSLKAAATDPVNVLTAPAGPWGRVGVGATAVIWQALKAGAANAAVEAGVQPFVQTWRAEAGLPHGLDQAVANIAAAGAFGALADAGVRSVYRGAQRGLGRQAVLDDAGGVVRYHPRLSEDPVGALEAAARARPEGDVLRRAAEGDADALREVARHAGLDQEPEVRGALQALDRERMFAAPDGVAPAEHQARLNAALDDDGLPPGHAIGARHDLSPAPEAMLGAPPLEMARALRAGIDPSAGQLPMHEGRMRHAVALSRLSDDAFAMVERGEVAQEVATLVGDRIPDPDQHGALLADLARDGVTHVGEARERLAYALARPADPTPQPLPTRVDDPAGPEASAQLARLSQELSDAIETATQTPRPARTAFAAEYTAAQRGQRIADFVEACRT